MTAHKHADLMLQYAQDAAETDKPWERWEYKIYGRDGEWLSVLNTHPDWNVNFDYRRKPQVIRVGRYEFPKPLTKAPEKGTVYWTIELSRWLGFYAERYEWLQNGEDESCIRQGLIHLTEDAAQAHADVLNAICRGDID